MKKSLFQVGSYRLRGRATVGTTEVNLNEALLTTIWAALLPTAVALDLSSSSANDVDVTGSGARKVTIVGLDANYAEQTEEVALNGQTKVTSTKTFLRVFEIYVSSCGSGFTNAGDIYAVKTTTGGTYTAGVPGTLTSLICKVLVGVSVGYTGMVTIPAGVNANLDIVSASCRGQAASVIIVLHQPAATDKTTYQFWKFELATGQVLADFHDNPVLIVPEKTDVIVRAVGAAAGAIIDVNAELSRTRG